MKYSKPARVLAWLGILLVLGLLVMFFVNAFVGENFTGSLYLIMVVPVIIWVIMFFAGFFREKPEDFEDDTENETKGKDGDI